MATSFGALCTDFYINQKLSLSLEMPNERQTVTHLFDRVRQAQPRMTRLRSYPDEISLESPRKDGQYQWLAMQNRSVRTGVVNPDTLEQAGQLHRLILEICPWYLSISPLELESVELLYGFDFECQANHNQVVAEALMADSPLLKLMDFPEGRLLDVQPAFGVALSPRCDLQALFEIKTRTTTSQIRRDRFRPEPLSIFMTLRRIGPFESAEQLPQVYDELAENAEKLATEKLVPTIIQPISRAIIGSA